MVEITAVMVESMHMVEITAIIAESMQLKGRPNLPSNVGQNAHFRAFNLCKIKRAGL